MSYLDNVNSPSDLKKIPIDKLDLLSQEIGDFVEKTVFATGGHLSSNLGIIDLTIAMHYVFDFLNEDNVVFDVSHQCYPHKILTGRKSLFSTLRQLNGITGFTNPKESDADNFVFGHAGTSISTSLGIASAKKLTQEGGKTLAVVGDASIGAGMSFEALNHAGHLNSNLIVILNDNGMSISKSVGSLAKYLNKIRLNSCYQEIRTEIINAVNKIPKVGKSVKETIEHLLDEIKNHIGAAGQNFFKKLNFDYFGPIDGHDIPLLIHSLNIIKTFRKPILLHVVTKKGNGHVEAMDNPERFHGIAPPANVSSNVPKHNTNDDTIEKNIVLKKQDCKQMAFTEIFSKAIIELASKDNKVVAITAAMLGGTGLKNFQELFPERCFDVGICEQHAIGFAAGLSLIGIKPICAIYSTFTQRAYDQIFQELCLNDRHAILATDRAGIVGEDGATHAGAFDITFLRAFPNMILMSPKDGFELKAMLKFALTLKHPASIRFPRDKSYSSPIYDEEIEPIALGKGQILKTGKDIILIGYGPMAISCMEASYLLEQEGIRPYVINARFAKPIDKKIVEYALNKNKTIITVEDHSVQGGFGSIFLEEANKIAKAPFNIHIHGIPDNFVRHGKRPQILKELKLDPIGIYSIAKQYAMQENLIYS